MPIVLVVGGAGFLGSSAVGALLRAGYRVRILDDLSTGSLARLRTVGRQARAKGMTRRHMDLILGDIRDAGVVRKAVRGATHVVHHAECRIGRLAPQRLMSVNVEGTLNILAAAQAEGVQRVVYGSSWTVYGESAELPLTESLFPRPKSPYAASKAAAEAYCRSYWEAYGLETVCLRYFNVYGPCRTGSPNGETVVPRFITALFRGVAPSIHGDGGQTRDFVFIDDAVRATLAATFGPNVGGRCVNVASGRMVSVRELLDLLCSLTDSRAVPTFLPGRTGDIRQSLGDTSLAQALLGTTPQVPLLEGLRRTVSYYRHAVGSLGDPPAAPLVDAERAHVRC